MHFLYTARPLIAAALLILSASAIHAQQNSPDTIGFTPEDAALPGTCKVEYPALSKRYGEQGTVMLALRLGADGVPLEATVLESSGFARLDAAGIAIAMSCRYPPRADGAIRVGKFPFHFRMSK